MKILVRVCAAAILAAALAVFLALAGSLPHGPKETWPTVTALLSVIAAVIVVFPALRVLEIQEDVLRPRPTPYFDLTSRYDVFQLRVKNLGGGVAYDVQLIWKTNPVNDQGDEVKSLDFISALVPQESVSTWLGVSSKMVTTFSNARFEGECLFKDSTGKKLHQRFVCSVDASQKQLVHDNELPKTLRDLQKVPEELIGVAEQLEWLIQKA